MAKKTSRGRRKTPAEKMTNDVHRHVTFSKRRKGIFKKASEICTLCNAQAAILAFSEKGKVYSFGHPSVEEVLDRFVKDTIYNGQQRAGQERVCAVEEKDKSARIQKLNLRLNQVLREKEKQNALFEEVKQVMAQISSRRKPVEECNIFELNKLDEELQALKKKVMDKMYSVCKETASTELPPQPYFDEGGLTPVVLPSEHVDDDDHNDHLYFTVEELYGEDFWQGVNNP
ncbi:hypothetical protein SAY86_023902 [Trapa natans]|uniref:MADS-box domain-containing protein n=1 Tax=Trapa natans TaxID=22666 RepID=A0AAN7LVM9_TRANT|nr:hypothetical protein SAY86_023902 [Trapa natans]